MLDAVRVAGSELRRVGVLVTDFLEFARPKPIVRAPVDARTICERAASTARPEAEQAGVAIETDLPAQPLTLEADAMRLEQVIGHLIANAIEAQDEGGRVVVRARREPRHVWIEVEDAGPGLPDPEAPIFDAFYSTKPDGTGLGLAIVHRIVADHDGDIYVESRPGATRFRLRLPLTRERLVT
jgi:signal transduction histidine kinase